MERRAPAALVIVVALAACGGGGEPPDPADGGLSGCPTHDSPTFELGTGATAFETLEEGQVLSMTSGPQGGCHFWLAVRTDGFAERLFNIAYALSYADTGAEIARSSQRVRLTAVKSMPGRCEFYGYTAFILRPWDVRDHHVRIDVTVTDDLGRSASASRTIDARWPPDKPGIPSESLCGPR